MSKRSKRSKSTADLSESVSADDDLSYSASSVNAKAAAYDQCLVPPPSGGIGGGMFGLSCLRVDLPIPEDRPSSSRGSSGDGRKSRQGSRTKKSLRDRPNLFGGPGKHAGGLVIRPRGHEHDQVSELSMPNGLPPMNGNNTWRPQYQPTTKAKKLNVTGLEVKKAPQRQVSDLTALTVKMERRDSGSTVSDLSTEDPTSIRLFDKNGNLTRAALQVMKHEEVKHLPEQRFVPPKVVSFQQRSVQPKRLIEV